ncbi:PAS domain-containing sensor histidine kinase [Polluticoccus soli]|uniref:PAS domain-containing sensor histidine kinase n=1 Tax=Polluticoccus soli TaxID=3034150 RepID=UPI0023E1BDF8|nr:PAS domain-containing sensor histidine kinase [Flavipsychrobacter sp. JY13-12]
MNLTGRQGFEALFNNAAIGIITVDVKGDIVLVNQFALKQFGYNNVDELIGKKIEILIPQRYKEKHVEHRDRYYGHNPHSRPMGTGMDLFAIKKDGTEFPVEVSLSVYNTLDGMFSIAFVSDITIRKKSESALIQLNADLEEKVKERTQSLEEALEKEKELNELKSRFVSMASHEFRTPLSTVLSSTYLLAQYAKTEDQPKREKHIQRIVSSVNLLTDILNDFLSVGKIEEGKIQVRFTEIDIKETISALVTELKTIVKPGQDIIYEHSGANKVLLDLALVKHIVLNLVSNAIKFSPENSPVYISTVNEDNTLLLSIKDKGLGISPEDQQHLFERFFRGANVTNIQGTGLGLHIVAKYVELMNGTITFNSTLGEGTEFIIKVDKTQK